MSRRIPGKRIAGFVDIDGDYDELDEGVGYSSYGDQDLFAGNQINSDKPFFFAKKKKR